jgi:hypothetical protein
MNTDFYVYITRLPLLVEITFGIGGLFAIASFLAKDILILRILFAIATLLFLVSGILILSPVMILVNSLHVIINMIQIVRLLIERYSLDIPEELRAVYAGVFSIMKPKEFLSLIKMGEKITTSKSKVDYLFRQGDVRDELVLILDGDVLIEKSGKLIARLAKHNFIGEMHFLTSKPMSADVRLVDELTYIHWHNDRLNRLKIKNPIRYANILTVLGQDLIHKIQNTELVNE